MPFLLFIDWWTKQAAAAIYGGARTLIPGLFGLEYVRNRGMFFGWFADVQHEWLRWALGLFPLIWVALFIWMIRRALPPKPVLHWAFACMIGGAAGNCLDRLVHGYITDFIVLPLLPVFNLADAAIVSGLIILGIEASRNQRGERIS